MSMRIPEGSRADHFPRYSSRASFELTAGVAGPSVSRDHSFRSARVGRTSSDELVAQPRALRSSSCRASGGAPRRLRRHHSAAADCERARRARVERRRTLELPRGPSLQSCSSSSARGEVPPPELEAARAAAGKETRRRRVAAAVGASFAALALASALVVLVTLTHSSASRAQNSTAKYYTFSVPPHHPLGELHPLGATPSSRKRTNNARVPQHRRV